jgi:beta-glucosidase
MLPPPRPSSDGFGRRRFLSLCAVLAGTAAAPPFAAAAPHSRRIEQLIARMTLEEKAGQLSCFTDVVRWSLTFINPTVNPADQEQQLADVRAGRIGILMNGFGVEGGRKLQKAAVEESRLGIPLLFAADVIHGYKTAFPIGLAEAASFDTALAERTARAGASEATAEGVHWNFAPMVDVGRDQRWGRVVEGAGEDPLLGARMAAARVRGFQGGDLRRDDTMAATAKHFAAYGAVGAGMDYNTVDISEATLREAHLPPFKAAFDAGAMTTMAAFTVLNGVPSTANPWLLRKVLRQEMGFQGPVISDYAADEELIAHGAARDGRDAARLAFLAGVDISMQSGLYNAHLPALVREGVIPAALVDAAVRRVLALKEALGLFDRPYRSLDEQAPARRIGTAENRALAREAGARSIVLLKNEEALLPLALQADGKRRIALIGPCASGTDQVVGPWAFFAQADAVDLAGGLRAALPDPALLSVTPGCGYEQAIEGGIAAAVAAARTADLVILAVGESQEMSGEAASRADIGLPAAQLALVEAVREAVRQAGTPVVAVLRHGRALALPPALQASRAILATWFLGSQAGHAIADVLFGKVNPSAHLPVSFPLVSGQQPFHYGHLNTGRPDDPAGRDHMFKARYREASNAALYPFGHGLSYTRFTLTGLALSASRLAWNGTLTVRATLSNTGDRPGARVVQLYLRDQVASIARPVRELKDFQRVELTPGESRTVSFTLTRAQLAFIGRDGRPVAEPGKFSLWVGDSSAGGLAAEFELAPA